MIVFSCESCGMKFRVKDEFAGRSTRCPTCKNPLVVPEQERTITAVGTGPVFGQESVLARAGLRADVSLDGNSATAAGPAHASVRELLGQAASGQRFQLDSEIARGGMGVVYRAVDCDLRREVAIKYLLDPTAPAKAVRFMEEAQITGQLEHPNIVPIHELGVDAAHRLFFSMKMVRGRTLAQVFDELRNYPRTTTAYSLARLLTILTGACNALAYAHSRRVVHRDLKPSNIMLGDFGEVYVMDWGLAKVFSAEAEQGEPAPASAVGLRHSPAQPSTVSTNREEADLTQEGSVLGTLLYMPPEQALGQLREIDARSDVYSLGAILYEMLALQPPIERQGGFAEILPRVIAGKMVPPEARAPERVRQGKIPPELSAIAMKALAREKAERYPSAEALRRDLELFLEGRAVSAKQDTSWEAFRKLVRRNKAASMSAALALLVLLGSLVFIGRSWLATTRAYAAYQKESQAKEQLTRQAVPALVMAGQLSANRQEFEHALTQVNLALAYDPNDAAARLLKAQLLVVKRDFAGAVAELHTCLKVKPEMEEGRKLLRCCDRPRPDELANLLALTQLFLNGKVPGLAEGILREYGSTSMEARKKLLELYRTRLEKHWPNLGNNFSAENTGLFRLNLHRRKEVTTLVPLEGVPLSSLILAETSVGDLAPLRGMPLVALDLSQCAGVEDLTPLRGMPLSHLNLSGCSRMHDLSPLRELPLQTIDLSRCVLVQDLSPLQGRPLTSLNLSQCRLVRELSPLKGMPLQTLNLNGCVLVGDLTPLRGMPLNDLDLNSCQLVRDLTPLQGMSLTRVALVPPALRLPQSVQTLRGMKSLQSIGLTTIGYFTVAEFWEMFDKGRFK